jgi:hypothetical protein
MPHRRPSPPLCQSCLRLHVRLPRGQRATRRQELVDVLGGSPEDVKLYALALFDHLTLAPKATTPDEIQPRHRTPAVPVGWGANGLDLVERSVIRIAFAL